MCPPTGNYAILQQQNENELSTAEWHTRLDRVFRFLQDVGYTLLSDVEPAAGGGVLLKGASKSQGPSSWCPNPGSARIPREDPDADGTGSIPLAKNVKFQKGGRQPSQKLAEVDLLRGEESQELIKVKLEIDEQEEVKEIEIGPSASRYAQFKDDLVLVWRFCGLLAEASPGAAAKVKHDTFYKSVLQGVRLMHLCDFDYSDIVVTLSYASTYFHSTYDAIGNMMSEAEAAMVCTLLIFLAHSFVLDETCPLRCWQKHVFRRYCSLKVLDAALFRLFNLRGFRLKPSKDEERHALQRLLRPVRGSREIVDGDIDGPEVGKWLQQQEQQR